MKTIENKTIKVIADLLEIDSNDISPDDSIMNDLGADDLDSVEIVMNCEKEFNIGIPDEKFDEIDTVSDLVKLINSILNNGEEKENKVKSTKTGIKDKKSKHKSNKNMETTISTPKTDCRILIEGAVPEIYKLNAFRISGLNVNASTRDISNQVKKNQMMEKYGDVSANHNSPFPIEPSPDSEQVNNAMHRLRDPETRLLDEFFWFWPHNIDSSNHDEALKSLSSKDIIAAEKIWIAQEATMTESNVSKHNLAVLAHLQALDFELNGKETTEELIKNRDENWDKSYKRWHQLLEHEGFWSRLTARVRQMDDPRLTTGFVKRLRDSLPTAILQINAQLALIAAENGNEEDVQRHLDLLYSSDFGGEDILAALKRVAEPLRNKIKITCKKYTNEEYPNPTDSLDASKKLIEQTAPMLKVLDLLLPEDSAILEGAHDEVALGAVGLLIDYGNNTEDVDLTDSIKVYEDVLEIALGDSAKVRVKQNYEIVKRNHEYYQTNHVCFYCKKNKLDDEAVVSHAMHGEVNRMYSRITWKHLTVKVPRCKKCRKEHNKQDTIITLGVLASVAIGITLGIIANNYALDLCCDPEWGDKFSNVNQLSSFENFMYRNRWNMWLTGLFSGIIGIILSIIAGIKSRKTKRYRYYYQFPQIQELYSEGWADGSEPNTEN